MFACTPDKISFTRPLHRTVSHIVRRCPLPSPASQVAVFPVRFRASCRIDGPTKSTGGRSLITDLPAISAPLDFSRRMIRDVTSLSAAIQIHCRSTAEFKASVRGRDLFRQRGPFSSRALPLVSISLFLSFFLLLRLITMLLLELHGISRGY